MPRLPPLDLFRAARISPHLRTLLPATRDLASARNELRWIQEHVYYGPDHRVHPHGGKLSSPATPGANGAQEKQIARLCRQRGQGVPLQYVLGSQPFGGLDIKCRPGVLIPRPETEAWVAYLGDLVKREMYMQQQQRQERERELREDVDQGNDVLTPSGLGVLDLCTGTGCIALSLYSTLAAELQKQKTSQQQQQQQGQRQRQRQRQSLRVLGLDVSDTAVALARENLTRNVRTGTVPTPSASPSPLTPATRPVPLEMGTCTITFERGDILSDETMSNLISLEEDQQQRQKWDVLVSNPPYISRDVWTHGRGQMGFSVRKYEPRLALVPGEDAPVYEGCEHEDVFYGRLLEIGQRLGTRLMVFEVGDEGQGARVVRMAMRRGYTRDAKVEIWRDWPDLSPLDDEVGSLAVDGGGDDVLVRGSGSVRAVMIDLR